MTRWLAGLALAGSVLTAALPAARLPRASPAAACDLKTEAPVDSLIAGRRFWHATRALPMPPGSRPLPPDTVVLLGSIAEGMGDFARVDVLIRRARGGDSLPDFIALAARADERAERWGSAAAKYRRLLALPRTPPVLQQGAAVRLAVALERSGSRDSAAVAWRRAAVAVPEIADWFAIRRAALERDTAIAFTTVSGARTPGAQLRADLFIAGRRMEAGNRSSALEVYRRQTRPLDIARAELALGRRRDARARADSVLFANPALAHGFLAALFLSENFDSLTVAENIATSRAYRARRELVSAERFARRAVEVRDTSLAAWLELARVLAERKQDGAALRTLDSARVKAGARRQTVVAGARVQVLLLLGREAQADSLADQLVRAHRNDTAIARAVLARAERHRALSERPQEIARYVTLLRRFPEAPASIHATFRYALLHYVDGRRDEAQALIRDALRRDSTGALGVSARYWDARLRYEELDTSAAGDLLRLARETPTSFYGTRARELLGDSAFIVDTTLDPPRPGTFPAARARERIRLLAAFGFEAEARAEAVGWVSDSNVSTQVLIAAAEAAGELGYAREAIALGEAARARAGMVRGVARALFPYSFRDVIEAEAAEHCVDPLLLAAIIRQESRFDPRAVSVVGARGLSQIWTPTGREMVQRLRLGSFNAELLYVPDFNLHLGTRYVQDRMVRDSFPVHALVASYNAGPGRVGRWRRWPEYQDPDLFVERVSIPETQNYVRIVYASYVWYKAAWQEPPPPPAPPLTPLP